MSDPVVESAKVSVPVPASTVAFLASCCTVVVIVSPPEPVFTEVRMLAVPPERLITCAPLPAEPSTDVNVFVESVVRNEPDPSILRERG